jgi:hypothetical protein
MGLEVTLLAPRNFAVSFRFLLKKKECAPLSQLFAVAGKLSCNFFYVVGMVTDDESF